MSTTRGNGHTFDRTKWAVKISFGSEVGFARSNISFVSMICSLGLISKSVPVFHVVAEACCGMCMHEKIDRSQRARKEKCSMTECKKFELSKAKRREKNQKQNERPLSAKWAPRTQNVSNIVRGGELK